MEKIVFPMFRGKTGQSLIGLAPSTATELGVVDGDAILVKKGEKKAKVKAWVTGDEQDLNPSGVCLDKKTREKLGVRTTVYFMDKPDPVDISKA